MIRWSDDGRSFIVLDEDEFARTLIPELFKHNNYASFVRQLNMYGFHKTVNITDGSLRQSEKARKGVKPPSMYSHPYFRKNRPDLLWLIQKPTSKTGAKRKRDGAVKDQFDSDDERQFSPQPGVTPAGEIGAPQQSAGQDVAQLPRNELASVRRELQRLQNQQRLIHQMIAQLKEQNDAFYRQASAFQALHDRHENSINAILTFLATFYNRSLDGHGGAANLVNLFGGAAQNQQQQQQDRVVEEFTDGAPEANNQVQRYIKRQPLLLGPGPVNNLQQPGSAVTAPNSARTSVSPTNEPSKRSSTSSAPPDRTHPKPTSTDSPIIKNDAPTPNMLNSVPESDQMMSFINNVNATNATTPSTAAPAFDFNSALDHYQNANGNAPLTPQQRDDMLALIVANQPGGDTRTNNALVSPQPPQMPDLNQLKETQQQLEMLTNLQRQQDDRVQELNRRLQPLSPTGAIPGVPQTGDENPFDLTGAPGDYDPNAFINFDDNTWGQDQAGLSGLPGSGNADNGDSLNFDFGNGAMGADGAADMNWDFGNTGGEDMFQTDQQGGGVMEPLREQLQEAAADGGGRVESASGSEATSPAVEGEGGTDAKRQRRV